MRPQKFTIIFSATNALTKWLKLDLPRLPSADGKSIGTQRLVTNSDTLSWQCHVVKNGGGSPYFTVIAVEAHSRFTLLLPFFSAPTQTELEREICQHWLSSLVALMVKHGEVARDQVPAVIDQFDEKVADIQWWRNTDLSVNGHVADAEQWVKETIADRGEDALTADEAVDLACHINQFFKRAKDKSGKQRRFYPVPCFVEDGLSRFASELFKQRISPYEDDNSETVTVKHDNVISLADYVARK